MREAKLASRDPQATDLALALELAAMAGAMAGARQRHPVRFETKDDGSPVTDVDRAVEKALRSELQKSRPDDAIAGEEFGELSGMAGAGSLILSTGRRTTSREGTAGAF